MNREVFLKLIVDQFSGSDLQIENITFESEYKKLEIYDSLTGMAIIASIEDEFRIKISDEDFQLANTIQSLFDLVLRKTNNSK